MSYVVYAVENGDRLVLMGPPVSGKPTLKPIALSFIQTPKQSKRVGLDAFGPDEPCSYEAAELIRENFIGQQVKFVEDYFIEPLQRSAGRLTLTSGLDASVMLLQAGLALVPDQIPPKMSKQLFRTYTDYMNAAKSVQKGLFAADAKQHVRALRVLSSEELCVLVDKVKHTEVLVRVERVLSGTVLIISADEFGPTQISVHMTGITVRDGVSDSVAEQAKFHTERFLLNRNVKVRFDGADNFGNILASVVSKKGSFQEELLSKGLAKIQQNTLIFSNRISELRAAEDNAKRQRAGVWVDYVDKAPPTQITKTSGGAPAPVPGLPVVNHDGTPGPQYTGPQDFQGLLVQVVHGDTVVVRDENTGKYVRMGLAGIRTSKNVVRDQDGNAPETRVIYNDYAWEAKEFLRTRFIGVRVHVMVEFARVMPETKEIRPSATVCVTDSGINIGLELLEEGLASFFLGKTDTCSTADTLRMAEGRAREAKKGLHSEHDALPVKVVELSHLGATRAQYYLSFLQRGMQAGRPPVLRGVVDLVLGPTSLRVYIPKEHFQIPVKVAGVIAPGPAFHSHEKSDAFADEARDHVVRTFQQREVQIQVFAADRAGNFISVVTAVDGTNLSVSLAAAGLATVGNIDKLPFAQQLLDAEEEARNAKRFIWSREGLIPQRAAKLIAERAASNPYQLSRVLDERSAFKSYMLTEVGEDGLSVYLQIYGDDVDYVKGKIQSLVNATVASGPHKPKKGELVVAQYATDKTWCRAKVVFVSPVSEAVSVQFIDFGNQETVACKNIRSIPRGPEYAIVRDTPAFAKLMPLAFLKTHVPNDAYVQTGCDTMYEYTDGEVFAKAVYQDAAGRVYYTVTTNENAPSLSETLLQRGLAILDKRTASVDPAGFKRHEAAQEIARKGHKALWQYGDVDDDDDDDY